MKKTIIGTLLTLSSLNLFAGNLSTIEMGLVNTYGFIVNADKTRAYITVTDFYDQAKTSLSILDIPNKKILKSLEMPD